jgi:hypothetical protein
MAFETHQTNEQILQHRHADLNNTGLHGYKEMPSLAVWKKDSFVGTGLFPRRADDLCLMRIDELLDLYPQSQGGQGLYITAEIFFTTMWWINNFKTQGSKMDERRRPAILRLNLCAANQVAELLAPCSIGEVTSKLKAMYGTGMSKHGKKTDRKQKPYYLGVLEREKYRVIFRNGLAYRLQQSWGQEPAVKRVDTSRFDLDGDRKGTGFVMTLSGAFYVADLGPMAEFTGGNNVRFHSCLRGGEPILSAGTVSVVRGRITRIKNDSGHYEPVDESLAQVLRKLRFSRVDISKITVEREGWRKIEGETAPPACPGDKFLLANGNWSRAQPMRFQLPKVA